MDDLGVVVIFTLLQDTTVPVGDLADWFDELGLEPPTLPQARIAPGHAFRQAATAFKVRYGRATTQAVMVGQDHYQLVYHLIRETKDRRVKGRVEHTKVGTLVLYRRSQTRVNSTERVRATLLHRSPSGEAVMGEGERKVLAEEVERFKARYAELQGHNHANRVRATLRDYLTQRLHAVGLRSGQRRGAGGVYFVPVPHAEEAYRLEELVRRIGQGASWHTLPVPDADRYQAMVSHYFTAHTCAVLEKLSEEVGELRRVRADRHDELLARYEQVAASCEVYAGVIALPEVVVETLHHTFSLLVTAAERIKNEEGER